MIDSRLRTFTQWQSCILQYLFVDFTARPGERRDIEDVVISDRQTTIKELAVMNWVDMIVPFHYILYIYGRSDREQDNNNTMLNKSPNEAALVNLGALGFQIVLFAVTTMIMHRRYKLSMTAAGYSVFVKRYCIPCIVLS